MSTPVERQNLLVPFFVLSSLVFAATVWSFYDEFVTRRPWRDYQKHAFKLERQRAAEEVAYYQKKLDEEETKQKLAKIEADLAEAKREAGSPEHQKKEGELLRKKDQLEIRAEEEGVKLKFLKSKLDDIYYRFKHAQHRAQEHEGEKKEKEAHHFRAEQEEVRKEMDDINARIAKGEEGAATARKEFLAAKSELDAFLNRIHDLTRQRKELHTPLLDAERKLSLAGDRSPDLTQYWLEKLGTVDRCQNCHVEIDRCGFSRPHEPVEAQKAGGKPEVVAQRFCLTPDELAGYTMVHDALCDGAPAEPGADAELRCFSAEEWHKVSEKAALYCGKKGPVRRWKLPEAGALPCPSKGDAEKILAAVDEKKASFDVPLFAQTHPYRSELLGSNHPPESFGCTSCHAGQGAQTKGVSSAEFQHGYDDHYWTKPLLNLVSYRKHQEIPSGDDGPGAYLTKQDVFVETSCARCHADDMNLKFAPALSKGRKLMAEIGCYGCHPIDKFNDYRKPGPQLTSVAEKMSPGFLVEWIKYPKAIRSRTRMPNFWPDAIDAQGKERVGTKQAEERTREATAIAAYLWKTSQSPESAATAPPGDAQKGEVLAEELGCRGCHAFEPGDTKRPIPGSAARDFAPNLSDVGSKVNRDWLFRWLKDPKAFWKQTRMPDLRLSDREAADVTAYLMTKTEGKTYSAPAEFAEAGKLDALAEQGKAMLLRYGCFGCHDVRGFEDTQRIGADLNDFGNKAVDLLDFGDAITNPREQTWYNWADLKLRHPRAYQYERVETRMPQFDLTDEEAELLMITLKSYSTEKVHPGYLAAQDERRQGVQQGEKLVDFYGCRYCHVIDDRGGTIRDRYEAAEESEDEEGGDRMAFAPPILNGEGFKTQPPWLHAFLRRPVPLRPWLKVRMPTFNFGGPMTTVASGTKVEGKDRASDLTRYFSASVNKPYPFVFTQAEVPRERLTKAEAMFTEAKCLQCHLSSDVIPEGRNAADMAPNLAMAKSRLRPDWIVSWLSDPQKLQPGTRMPSFFFETEPGKYGTSFPSHLDGNAVDQMQALTDFLMHFEPPKADKTAMK